MDLTWRLFPAATSCGSESDSESDIIVMVLSLVRPRLVLGPPLSRFTVGFMSAEDVLAEGAGIGAAWRGMMSRAMR